jgi:hypothetical protein
MTRALSPAEIASHALLWAAVGIANTSVNHAVVAGEKLDNGSVGT